MLSPGIQVNEIDLSIVIPTLGNSTACFAGVFTQGPTDKYVLITNADELIQYFGKPTNENANDWFQCYNFLQYANKLLVSRAVDSNGTASVADDAGSNITVATEATEGSDTVELSSIGSIAAGDVLQFGGESIERYEVKEVAGTSVILTSDLSATVTLGAVLYTVDQAYNALATAAAEGETASTIAELRKERMYIGNEESYEVMEPSIAVLAGQKVKFTAKSTGKEMNGVEIAIARQADFSTGASEVFEGILLNGLFEVAPNEANEEIALVIRKDEQILASYIVSLKEGAKDYKNKSVFIEDVLFKYDPLVYAKVSAVEAMPEARLFKSSRPGLLVTDPNIEVTDRPAIELSNGSDGEVNAGDIAVAYGSVSDNTIFGGKEDVDIDIVIANEQARAAAGTLATERADCIAFIGGSYDEIVGQSSAKIVENLINTVNSGELNQGGVATSYNAFFGNYKYQYDKYNDKFRSNKPGLAA